MATISATEKAAQAWCTPATSGKQMDPELAAAFADILDEIWNQPWLGNATTKELRDELRARGPRSPDDYRTFVPDCTPPITKDES